jgi:ABC-type nitrate/sulfonate/bicarbonate transport system substrate-binding protein
MGLGPIAQSHTGAPVTWGSMKSRILQRTTLARVALMCLLILGQCNAHALESTSLQLKWLHQYQFAGYYEALEQGYYRDAGFNVEIREGGPNVDPASEVALGKADFGVCTSGLLLRSPTDPALVSLAVVFQHSAAVILTTRASGITNIAQIASHPFMDTPGSDELAGMLKSAGVDYAALPRIQHNGDPRDLVNRKADAMVAYSTNEPFVLDEMGEPYRTFSPRAVGIDFYGDNLCASERLVAAKPERVAAFRAASLKGWQYALAHKEETVDLILRQYSSRKGREALLFEASQTDVLIQPDLIELGYQNPERWHRIAETYRDLGMVKVAAVPKGLIYGLNRESIPTWLKYSLGVLVAFAAMASLALSRVAALNKRLKSENIERKRMEVALQEALTQAETESWIKTNEGKIGTSVQQADTIQDLTQKTMSILCPMINAQHGLFYIFINDRLEMRGRYGYRERKHLNTQFALGQGLIGQCALERQPITITKPSEDYIQINSGPGVATPAVIAVLPIIHADQLRGVIELASLTPFSPREITLLDHLMPILGMHLELLERSLAAQLLLKETQEQAARMAAQAAQLEEQSVEMEAHRRRLGHSRPAFVKTA